MALDERPAVSRRRARSLMRTARGRLRETPTEMATALGWPLPRLLDLETGAATPTAAELIAVVARDRGEAQIPADALEELAANAALPSLADRFRQHLTPQFAAFVEYEEATRLIRQYETKLVPGPLQTEEYALAALRNYLPTAGATAIEQCLAARMARCERLREDQTARGVFILDESSLRRAVGAESGATGVLERQTRYLLEMSERPNIDICVMPFGAGMYPAIRGPFVVLECDDELTSTVLYRERAETETVECDTRIVSHYLSLFIQAESLAVNIERMLGHA
jgi:hypothetical protein